ncbi:MAG: DNA adenine methylase [Candidatus Binataceae bacterium]
MKRSPAVTQAPARRLIHFTPLRYPGGKGKLASFVKKLIELNRLSDGEYVEPYAGGAAIALELLFQEYVSHIHINDISRPVYAFWKTVLDHTEDLTRLVRNTPLTVRAWDKQKRIMNHQDDEEDIALGFATFFLNRTNRSGILNGGIIGGRDQSGPWKIDARFNAAELIHRIESIAKLRRRIRLSREDAETFLINRVRTLSPHTLVYLDPPYYTKGKALYYDYYCREDHEKIADLVTMKMRRQKWIVSYDNVQPIRDMYAGCRHIVYGIGYSAREVREGGEVMFFSDGLQIPPFMGAMRPLGA